MNALLYAAALMTGFGAGPSGPAEAVGVAPHYPYYFVQISCGSSASVEWLSQIVQSLEPQYMTVEEVARQAEQEWRRSFKQEATRCSNAQLTAQGFVKREEAETARDGILRLGTEGSASDVKSFSLYLYEFPHDR